MGLKRPSPGLSKAPSATDLSEDAQDLMRDNLDVMEDIVMRLREDPDYAKTIYADCPRLQYHLDQNPDLRPIFEDPELVRLNFEQVYREAGGKLPEDEEVEKKISCWKQTLVKIVNSPLFKLLRVILVVKKIVGCITGGGIGMITGCLSGGACCCESPPDLSGPPDLPDGDGNGGNNNTPEGVDPNALEGGDQATQAALDNAANKAALNSAADYMSDPEIQEQMTDLLDNDPEGLAEAIDNDPELSALRDSNPLCAELMSDPETMRILVDPDNLRALGDCPELIQMDFADPNWAPPDLETGTLAADHAVGIASDADMLVDGAQVEDGVDGAHHLVDLDDVDYDDDYDDDDDYQDEYDEENPDADDQEDGEEDGEEEEEEEGEEYELGDKEENNNSSSKAKSANKKSQNNQKNQQEGSFFSRVTGGITDYVAAQVVGNTLGDFMPGGGDDLGLEGVDDGGLADQAGDAADSAGNAADSAAQNANNLAGAAEFLASDGVADNLDHLDNLEGGMDEVQDGVGADADKPGNTNNAVMYGAIGGATGAAIGYVVTPGDRQPGPVDLDEDPEVLEKSMLAKNQAQQEEEEEPKKRFGWFGDLAAAVSSAAKETVVGTFLGDDLGQMVVENHEERADEKAEAAEEEAARRKGEGLEEEPKKRKGVFRRSR